MGFKNPSNASFETGEESMVERRTYGARSGMQETHNNQVDQDQMSYNIDHRVENYRDGTWIE